MCELENIKCELTNELEKILEINQDLTYQLQDANKEYNDLSIKYLKISDNNLHQSDNDINKVYKENQKYVEVL